MSPAAELKAQHRRQQLAIRALLLAELLREWPALDWTRLDATFPAWAAGVTRLVQTYRANSAATAANYLTAYRYAEGITGVGPTDIQPAATAPVDQVTTLLRITSVVAVKTATARDVDQATAMRNAYVLSSGAASRLVLDGGRRTVVDTVTADRYALGWERQTSGHPCAFCAMLASRGPVYKEQSFDRSDPRFEGDGDFKVHDHCSCLLEPVYRETPDSAQTQRLEQLWRNSTTGLSGNAAVNAFRRAYSAPQQPPQAGG